jgi:hypothetical protein
MKEGYESVPRGGVITMNGIYKRPTWLGRPYEQDMRASHRVGPPYEGDM